MEDVRFVNKDREASPFIWKTLKGKRKAETLERVDPTPKKRLSLESQNFALPLAPVLPLADESSDLEGEITLAALRARNTRIVLRKKLSPRKYEVAEDEDDLEDEGNVEVLLPFQSKMGLAASPNAPQAA